jgi:hypothetical protein
MAETINLEDLLHQAERRMEQWRRARSGGDPMAILFASGEALRAVQKLRHALDDRYPQYYDQAMAWDTEVMRTIL